MRLKLIIAAGLMSLAHCAGAAVTMQSLAEHLHDAGCYNSSCTYRVYLPTHSEPVEYTVNLHSADTAPGDTLAPCNYMIEWSLPTASGVAEGFSAYFSGTHFRFRDKRLQEYHSEWDMTPFAPRGFASGGVQYQNQFADLLPQFLGDKLDAMIADEAWQYKFHPDTVVAGQPAVVVDGCQRTMGYTSIIFSMVFDRETLLPRAIEYQNNPDQISEQSVSVSYSGTNTPANCRIDLDTLMSLHSGAFEKYRENSFSLETLPGRPLPEISAPTPTGERYFRRSGDPFAAPTVVVFLDADVASTSKVIGEVRSALQRAPVATEILWAFINKRADDIDEIIARPEPGEFVLMSATGAARDCGVGAITPVLVFCSKDGTVSDIINGYNNDLPALVIQKATLAGMK